MRKHIILFFSALLFLFACHDDEKTKGIIPRDQMVSLLVDIHLVDGAMANQASGDSIYKNGTGRYLFVLKQHHTDTAKFKKSMQYYTGQPDVGMKLYDDIIKILQAKTDSLNKIVAQDNEITRKRTEAQQKKEQKAREDSLAKKGIKVPPGGMQAIDQKRRMEMSAKPKTLRPANPALRGFKKAL